MSVPQWRYNAIPWRAMFPASRTLALIAALSAAVPSASRADGGTAAPALGPADAIELAPWQLRADLSVEASLSLREVWEPVSLAPDVHVGLPGGAVLGLYHSRRAAGLLDSGAGLCPGGDDRGCVDRYSGLGLRGLSPPWRPGSLELRASLRVDATRFEEPAKPRLAAGAVASLRRGRLAVLVDAHLSMGLWNLERGNENRIIAPLWLGVDIAGPVDGFLRTGLSAPLSGFGDAYEVPLGLGLGARLHRRLRIEVQIAFPRLLGPLNTERPRDLLLRLIALP